MTTRTNRIKGIIFDMDNTLLQSSIDFPAMKQDVFRHLVAAGVLPRLFPVQDHTTATLLEAAKHAGISDSLYEELLAVAVKHELAGMEGAGLEPGAEELLAQLHGSFVLAVVTNNAWPAAQKALEETGIIRYFDLVAGREQMTSLKPSPSGFLYVKGQFPDIAEDEWLSVGDSWIDGKGSADANIPFVCYRTPRQIMDQRGVPAIGRIEKLEDLLPYIQPSGKPRR
ncbi:HAD family hydrolase [Paenibacillus sp. MBLB4367]|uniref:HAD family hydrolase n=1 Tax=Paenibacillus sp. MBLB4367 TaxID=3384767 RepID=UPI0039083AA2